MWKLGNSVVYVTFTSLSVQLWWAKNRQKISLKSRPFNLVHNWMRLSHGHNQHSTGPHAPHLNYQTTFFSPGYKTRWIAGSVSETVWTATLPVAPYGVKPRMVATKITVFIDMSSCSQKTWPLVKPETCMHKRVHTFLVVNGNTILSYGTYS